MAAGHFVEWTRLRSERLDLVNDPAAKPRDLGQGNSVRASLFHTLRDMATDLEDISIVAYGGNLAAAVTALGSTRCKLTIPRGVNAYVCANLTIPRNITLHFIPGGMVSVTNNATLTPRGYIERTIGEQIWNVEAGSSVVFDDHSVTSEVYPEDWGAQGDANLVDDITAAAATDDTAAFKAAVAAFPDADSVHPGRVMLRARTYKVTDSVVWRDSVMLQGLHGRYNYSRLGSVIAFRPTSAKDFISLAKNSWDRGYAYFHMEGICLEGSGTYARDAVTVDFVTTKINNVFFRGWTGTHLVLRGGMNCLVEFVESSATGSGYKQALLVDWTDEGEPGSTVASTTIVFKDCLWNGGAPTVGTEEALTVVKNAADVVFERCIWDGIYGNGDACRVNRCDSLRITHPHMEQVRGRHFIIGSGTPTGSYNFYPYGWGVRSFLLHGLLCCPTSPDNNADVIYLDQCDSADLEVAYAGGNYLASLVRYTERSGFIKVRKPSVLAMPAMSQGTTREDSHTYAAGDWILVTDEETADGGDHQEWQTERTLMFVCTTAGQSASSVPEGYRWGAESVTDGAAVFKHVADVSGPRNDRVEIVKEGTNAHNFIIFSDDLPSWQTNPWGHEATNLIASSTEIEGPDGELSNTIVLAETDDTGEHWYTQFYRDISNTTKQITIQISFKSIKRDLQVGLVNATTGSRIMSFTVLSNGTVPTREAFTDGAYVTAASAGGYTTSAEKAADWYRVSFTATLTFGTYTRYRIFLRALGPGLTDPYDGTAGDAIAVTKVQLEENVSAPGEYVATKTMVPAYAMHGISSRERTIYQSRRRRSLRQSSPLRSAVLPLLVADLHSDAQSLPVDGLQGWRRSDGLHILLRRYERTTQPRQRGNWWRVRGCPARNEFLRQQDPRMRGELGEEPTSPLGGWRAGYA